MHKNGKRRDTLWYNQAFSHVGSWSGDKPELTLRNTRCFHGSTAPSADTLDQVLSRFSFDFWVRCFMPCPGTSNTTWGSSPKSLAHTAVARQWLDWRPDGLTGDWVHGIFQEEHTKNLLRRLDVCIRAFFGWITSLSRSSLSTGDFCDFKWILYPNVGRTKMEAKWCWDRTKRRRFTTAEIRFRSTEDPPFRRGRREELQHPSCLEDAASNRNKQTRTHQI